VREILENCLKPENNPDRHTLLPVFLDKAREHLAP
jgi:hypothetical protein